MSRLKLIAISALASLLSGCVLSFYPLFEPKQTVFDPNLVGVWKYTEARPGHVGTDEKTFVISRPRPEENFYWIEMEMRNRAQGAHDKGSFYAEIGVLGTNRYLQVAPRRSRELYPGGMYGSQFIEVWTFWKLKLNGDKMELMDMSYEWLEAMVKSGKIAIKHEQRGRDWIVLTAPTEDLQSFVAKYTDQAFKDGSIFVRQKSTPASTTPPVKNTNVP